MCKQLLLNKKTENFIKLIPDLVSQERIETYDPQIIIVPDFLNDESIPLFSSAFSNITQNNDAFNRIIVITEALLPPISNRKLLIPELNDRIMTDITPDLESLEILERNPLVTRSSNISFSDRLNAAVPFINYLLPGKPVIPLLNFGLKASEICSSLEDLNINDSDLIIVLASLSVGLSKSEAVSNDTALVTILISQDEEVKAKATPYSSILNAVSKLSFSMRLRPRFFKYLTATHQGRKVIRVKGICSIGYFY